MFFKSKSFNKIPQELLSIILEFVEPQDFDSIRKAIPDFKELFKKRKELWAIEIFHTIIQVPTKIIIQFKLQEVPKYFKPSELEFTKYADPEIKLTSLTSSQLNIKTKLEKLGLTDSKKTEKVINRFMKILADPNPPEPILKKDIHLYSTGSEHQTYLTEVYNAIVHIPRSDKERDILKEIFTPKILFTEKSDLLIKMRWYQYEEIENDENSQYYHIVEFYLAFVNFVKNFCDIMREYVDCIEDDKRTLKEYTRVWTEYSFMIREFDTVLSFFRDYINKIYAAVYPEHYQKPSFSIWKLMLKIWYDEVFLKLDKKLTQKYMKLFRHMLVNDTLLANIHADKAAELKNEFEKMLKIDEFIPVLNEYKKMNKCLRKYMNCVDDMSLNEHTVFYNDCTEPNPDTPKGKFLEKINNEIKDFNLVLLKNVENTTELRSILNKIEDYLGLVMNKPSATHVFTKILDDTMQNSQKLNDTKGVESLVESLKKRGEFQKIELYEESDYLESRGHYKIKKGFEQYFNWYSQKAPQLVC